MFQCWFSHSKKRVLKKIAKDLELKDRIEKMQESQCYMTHRQWLNRLKTFKTKKNASFIAFNIESFYPSILPKLFHKAINFVKTIRDIPDKDIAIIM